jgi:hypothetical protein
MHSFCISPFMEASEGRRRGEWRCPNCMMCGACKKCDDSTLLVCDVCDGGRHLRCVMVSDLFSKQTCFPAF